MKLFAPAVIALFVLSSLYAATDQDADLSLKLIGSWIPAEREEVSGSLTLNSNGSGTEIVTAQGVEIRVKIDWKVSNGILEIKALSSSHPNLIPVGIQTKDRIISISEERYEYEPLGEDGSGSGKREFSVRKK